MDLGRKNIGYHLANLYRLCLELKKLIIEIEMHRRNTVYFFVKGKRMKNKWKRITSLLMLMVLSLSSALAGGVPVAEAAEGEKAKVVMIDYPRSGDANYSGEWGTPALSLMNGWEGSKHKGTGLRVIGSYSGNIAYCIEPGVAQKTGDNLVYQDENYFNQLPESFNKTLSGSDIRLFIGRVLQYGYQGGLSTKWNSANESHANAIAHAYATQLMIWEVVVGERDEYFNLVDTGGKNRIMESVSAHHPLRSKILYYYHSMETSVKTHTKIPSFMSRIGSSAKAIELEWNGSEYVATLEDTNKVVSNYQYSSNISDMVFQTNGNQLIISTKKAPKEEVLISATKIGGKRRGVVTWTDGNRSQSGGVQDLVTYAQEVSDPVSAFLKVKVSYGNLDLVKTSEDGKVDGIQFTLEGNGIKETITTADGGKIKIDNLLAGSYTVTEHSYDKYEPQKEQVVEVIAGETAKIQFDNQLKKGTLKVIKNSEDQLVEGMSFRLHGTSLSGAKVDIKEATNKEGIATFSDVLISGAEPYVIEEVNTPDCYVVPASQEVPIQWEKVATRQFQNDLKKFSVTMIKVDSETGESQGNASLEGAVYGIYKGEELVDEYTTDKLGKITTREYVCGDNWTIREIKPSEGYLLDKTIHKVGAEAKKYTLEHNQIIQTVTEEVKRGKIGIVKHTDNGETQIETPEAGATFQVYLKSAGSYDAAKEIERDEIVCDEDGFAETKELPYGVYHVQQTKGWEGKELLDTFEVFISEHGKVYRFIINNRTFESHVQVVKVDEESGKTIPYAGAGFQIYDPSGNKIEMSFAYPTPTTIDTFYTNEEGSLVTPEVLPYGKGYSIVEVQAPHGYVLDKTPVFFDIVEGATEEEDGISVVKVKKANMAQKGVIVLDKIGETFFDVSEVGSKEDGLVYQPIYKNEGLEGAVYEIKALKDIYTPDGTLRYKEGEVVDKITTDKEGHARSQELYLGTYGVKEVQAPHGMVVNQEEQQIELRYEGQEISVTEVESVFYNERQKVEVSLDKVLEKNEIYQIGYGSEYKNVIFALFADEELVSQTGKVIPKDGKIEIITIDENGRGVVQSDLPLGSYYIQEVATDEHYVLDQTKYPVVFAYAGQDTKKVELKANEDGIENKLILGEVKGLKKDENGEVLAGAKFGIFSLEITEFTTENALHTTTSDKEGRFSFTQIPYGNWVVREIEQPEGYVLDETIYDIVIQEMKQVIEIEVINEAVYGHLSLTKVDAQYPDNKLTGAEFEVYKDVNKDGAIDKDDELLVVLEEREVGIYRMDALPYGGYLVKETKAPEGFLLDSGVYSVMIEEDEKVYEIENEAGIGFVNDAMTGTLKVMKSTSDGKLEGFAFRVTDPNGYDVTMETDKNGIIRIEKLRVGTYKVAEVANKASAVYIMPDDQTVTISNGEESVVEMHNELKETPKTGDNRNLSFWYLVLAVSGASVVGLMYLGKKKQPKEETKDDE